MVRLIIDCDPAMGSPGSEVDDGFAIALALADPEIQLEAITTVNGNIDVHAATILTGDLMKRLGRPDIPIYKGAADPLLRVPLPHYEGPYEAADPTFSGTTDEPAAMALVRLIRDNPGELTIAAIGPLTNLALAIRMAPEIVTMVKEVMVMGGCFLSHTNKASMPGEYNIWVDPEAAQIVVDSGMPLRFVGLDVTLQVLLTRADAEVLEGSDSAFAQFAGRYAHAWIDYSVAHFSIGETGKDACAMHDPLAIAAITSPDLIEWAPANLAFGTDSERTRGVSIADLLRGENAPAANCEIAVDVDANRFMELFLTRLRDL